MATDSQSFILTLAGSGRTPGNSFPLGPNGEMDSRESVLVNFLFGKSMDSLEFISVDFLFGKPTNSLEFVHPPTQSTS
jgi:hypothetical protein